ncbi:hypothetical protein ACI2LJ_33610 [Streptomyces sp. NPDC088090]|uniref:hypothetical protein n=1 Tax=Streptomyces sp. NPDC088090 TaxID=3365822 RepID=UPI00384F16D9
MFDHLVGLRPEEAARRTALVDQYRPVLAREGMEVVHDLPTERGMSIGQSIAITRALLGRQKTSLRIATAIATGLINYRRLTK